MNPKELMQIRYQKEWYDFVPPEKTKAFHQKNVEACLAASAHHEKKDRPLSILAVHGSGRSSFRSCAHELSNSQLLLHGALEQFRGDSEYEVKEVALRQYNIEPCNNCYATASALCGFPCNCFPLDPMQELYPLVLRCDVMFCSTGVNQSAMSTRLKAFLDRLISLDGGFYVAPEQYQVKDAKWRDHCIALSARLSKAKELPYDARMWGRVAAYFITSKDEKNNSQTIARDFTTPLSYIELVAETLRDGNADYGFFHHKKSWYVGAWSNPNEELCYDKRWLFRHPEFSRRAELVAKVAVNLGRQLRKSPPKFDGGGRGRTRT